MPNSASICRTGFSPASASATAWKGIDMTITRKQLERMRSHDRMRSGADLEDMILARYGEEPDGPEYTEQDLHEQIRKLINQYNHEHPDPNFVATPTPWAGNRPTAAAAAKQRRKQKL
jgi:hypothetical protein